MSADDPTIVTLSNCQGMAEAARKAVLELLSNISPDYNNDAGEMEDLRPAFAALDNLNALLSEAEAAIEKYDADHPKPPAGAP